jgi:predicted nuclease of predicted toxin-antitoxin system
MRILVDENIPRVTVERLRECGHDVMDIRGTESQGLSDLDLWDVAIADRRALITTDKGFTQNRRTSHFGILIVRLRQPNRMKIHRAAMHAIGRFQESDGRDLWL